MDLPDRGKLMSVGHVDLGRTDQMRLDKERNCYLPLAYCHFQSNPHCLDHVGTVASHWHLEATMTRA